MQDADTTVPDASDVRVKEALWIAGRLEVFSPFEILQISHQLRKFGLLELTRDDGVGADCRIGEAGLFEARCGHRHGREAILTFIWWKKGSFRFVDGQHLSSNPAGEAPVRIPELMMDAVRMADELEYRAEFLPSPGSPLTVAKDAPVEDKMGCRLIEVFDFIKSHPGVTTAELEQAMPLSPVQLRLSIALMVQAAILGNPRHEEKPKEVTMPLHLFWWHDLTRQFPGGLRVLIGAVPEECTDVVWQLVKRLATTLEVPAPTVVCSSTGPSFVRLRAPQGGVLSLTILPVMRKNRYLFESFVPSMQACFLSCDERVAPESRLWRPMVPKDLPHVFFEDASGLDAALLEQLRKMSRIG